MNKMRTKRVYLQNWFLPVLISLYFAFFFLLFHNHQVRGLPEVASHLVVYRHFPQGYGLHRTKRASRRKPFSYFDQEILKVLISNGLIVKVKEAALSLASPISFSIRSHSTMRFASPLKLSVTFVRVL